MVSHKILVLGAGRMGGAIINGLLTSKQNEVHLSIIEPSPHIVDKLGRQQSATIFSTVDDLPIGYFPDAIIVALKPQVVSKALQQMSSRLKQDTLVLSVAAGVSIQHIRDATHSEQPVVRCVPNLAAELCLSPSVAVASPELGSERMRIAEQILQAVGSVRWIADEDTMHAVTAISGSGPAYLFAFAEAFTEAATALGISRDLALHLSLDTISGATALLQKHKNPGALCDQVASPGGTTQAALEILHGTEGLRKLMARAALAAANRSRSMSDQN